MTQPTADRALAMTLLATGVSKSETAERCGISRPTLYRWLAQEDFAAGVERLRGDLAELVTARLLAAAPDAVKRWHDIVLDTEARDSDAISAGDKVLKYLLGEKTQIEHSGTVGSGERSPAAIEAEILEARAQLQALDDE